MLSFFVAIVMFPTVQRKAQEELDLVVGADRLPTIGDLRSLPYVQAIYMETLRWAPVLPLAVPHRAILADEYEGYHIPAGSVVIGVCCSDITLTLLAQSTRIVPLRIHGETYQ